MNAAPAKRTFVNLCACSVVLVAILAAGTISSLLAQKPANPGTQIDELLRNAVNQKKLAGVVAMAWRGDKLIYQGAAGQQDARQQYPDGAEFDLPHRLNDETCHIRGGYATGRKRTCEAR